MSAPGASENRNTPHASPPPPPAASPPAAASAAAASAASAAAARAAQATNTPSGPSKGAASADAPPPGSGPQPAAALTVGVALRPPSSSYVTHGGMPGRAARQWRRSGASPGRSRASQGVKSAATLAERAAEDVAPASVDGANANGALSKWSAMPVRASSATAPPRHAPSASSGARIAAHVCGRGRQKANASQDILRRRRRGSETRLRNFGSKRNDASQRGARDAPRMPRRGFDPRQARGPREIALDAC